MSLQKKHILRQAVRRFRCQRKRRCFKGATVLAVTGSCGKTTATAFLSKILSDRDACFSGVHDNDANSVMRNILRVPEGTRFVVQEVSGHQPGQLSALLPLLKPDIGIVTTVGQDHYRCFRTLDATAAEKGTLVERLPKSGAAVLNADDPHVAAMAGLSMGPVLTYGRRKGADVRASDIRSVWPERLSMMVTHQQERVRIETNLFGDLLVSSVLAAVAGALAAGVSLAQCAESLQGIETFPRRMSIHRSALGSWFVCDTCKAPFWSVSVVLKQMERVDAPRKTVVLGAFSDMSGSVSEKYRRMAREALEVADRVLFVGTNATRVRKMLSPAVEDRLFLFEHVQDASRFLAAETVPDEVVLVKSSNREHLERLVFGQDTSFACWKAACSKLMSCDTCEQRELPDSVAGKGACCGS